MTCSDHHLHDALSALHRAHGKLRRLLDIVDARVTQLELGVVPKNFVEDAVYDLYVAVDEHLVTEERLLDPLVERLSADAAARLHLVFEEHDGQREVLLSAVACTEEGRLAPPELVDLARRLTRMLRADLALEEELFEDLTRAARAAGERHSP